MKEARVVSNVEGGVCVDRYMHLDLGLCYSQVLSWKSDVKCITIGCKIGTRNHTSNQRLKVSHRSNGAR